MGKVFPIIKRLVERFFLEIKTQTNRFWDCWETKSWLVNFSLSSLLLLIYYLGFLGSIRENSGSIITYAAALLTLNGVFLTLLVTLKGSPIFERLKKVFPVLHAYLYDGLKKQVQACIYFILINLGIGIVGEISNPIIAFIGIIVWSYFLIHISLGALYSLRVVTNLAASDPEQRKPMS